MSTSPFPQPFEAKEPILPGQDDVYGCVSRSARIILRSSDEGERRCSRGGV